MKERITITLDKNIIKAVDNKIDGMKVKNRSHAIEMLISKSLGHGGIKKALILAGGKGAKLRPITHEIPLPLIPVKGRPILEQVIELLKIYDIRDIIISIGYKGDKIKAYFGNGSKFGVKITYIEEKEALGTAGALKLAKPLLDGPFILAYADELKDIDLEDMFAFHKSNKALATIALTTVHDPSAYGVAKMKGSKIVQFVEKPKLKNAPSKLINAGLAILEPEVIDMIPKKKGVIKLEVEVFPKIAKTGKLFGYPFEGQWFDTSTPERYEKAIHEWKGYVSHKQNR